MAVSAIVVIAIIIMAFYNFKKVLQFICGALTFILLFSIIAPDKCSEFFGPEITGIAVAWGKWAKSILLSIYNYIRNI